MARTNPMDDLGMEMQKSIVKTSSYTYTVIHRILFCMLYECQKDKDLFWVNIWRAHWKSVRRVYLISNTRFQLSDIGLIWWKYLTLGPAGDESLTLRAPTRLSTELPISSLKPKSGLVFLVSRNVYFKFEIYLYHILYHTIPFQKIYFDFEGTPGSIGDTIANYNIVIWWSLLHNENYNQVGRSVTYLDL